MKQFIAGILTVSLGICLGYAVRPNAHQVVRDEYRRNFHDAREVVTGVGLNSESTIKFMSRKARILYIDGYKDYDVGCFRYPRENGSYSDHTDCFYFEDITEH